MKYCKCGDLKSEHNKYGCCAKVYAGDGNILYCNCRKPYGRITVKLVFAWYDLWIGVFVDKPKKRIYVFPIPCVGFVVQL